MHDLTAIGCASLPGDALAALAEIRCRAGVQVALADGRAWVRWEPGDLAVLFPVLAVTGSVLYLQRDGHWYRHNYHLPDFDFPERLAYRPLHQMLLPAAVEPLPPSELPTQPTPLTLIADQRPRPVTALRCDLSALVRWADGVPTTRLAALRAAHCDGKVLLLGKRLPLVPEGERFWGERLLVPLGWRPEPALPERALAEALALDDGELILLHTGAAGGERIPLSALRPVTRAGLRLALEGEGR